VFEETARFIAFLFLKRRNYSGVANALSYGAGHGGIEAILLTGMTMINNLIVSLLANIRILPPKETFGASGGITEASINQINDAIRILSRTDSGLFLVAGLERIFAINIHIALSVIVWYSVMSKKVWLFPLAILLHAAVDVPAVLAQTGVITSIAVIEGLVGISSAVLAAIAFAVHKANAKLEEQNDN
jgi:uncharacterized membrane protein YhfC